MILSRNVTWIGVSYGTHLKLEDVNISKLLDIEETEIIDVDEPETEIQINDEREETNNEEENTRCVLEVVPRYCNSGLSCELRNLTTFFNP